MEEGIQAAGWILPFPNVRQSIIIQKGPKLTDVQVPRSCRVVIHLVQFYIERQEFQYLEHYLSLDSLTHPLDRHYFGTSFAES